MNNKFHTDLLKSESLPIPDSFYYKIFSDLKSIVTIPRNHQLQCKGRMDKVLIFKNGKQIRIEEKCRYTNYGDLLIEEYSAVEYNSAGWIIKPSVAQYLVYYIHDTGKGYIYNLESLQNEWKVRNSFFKLLGKRVESANEGYTTLNWAIPFKSIKSHCQVVQ